MSKQLFEEETLSHAALAEEKDILSPFSESRDKLGEPFLFVKLKSRQHQASCGRHRAGAAVGTTRRKQQSKIYFALHNNALHLLAALHVERLANMGAAWS